MRLAMAEGLDRRAARIAGGGAHDVAGFALRQRPVHQPGQQLHGDVLEGECRTVEQFEQAVVGVELLQGRHRVVAKLA